MADPRIVAAGEYGQLMSPRTESITDERRVQKYLERANDALNSPLLDLWPLESPGKTVTMFIPTGGGGPGQLEEPTINADAADATIARLRPFIMSGEDIYIPTVINSAKRLVAQAGESAAPGLEKQAIAALDYIGDNFAGHVDGRGHFKVPYWHSGSGPADGVVQMLPDNELATHYVYGRLVHSDEWRLEELQRHGWQAEAFQAMLRHVHELMRIGYWLRQRLNSFIELGLIPGSVSARSAE
jgi:hypothetical protein